MKHENEKTHHQIHELLALQLYGELAHEEERLLAEHLTQCPACAKFGRELRTKFGPLIAREAERVHELPSNWDERLRRAVPAPRRSWLRPTATFVAGLAAGLLVMAVASTEPPATRPPSESVTIATNAGETRSPRLPSVRAERPPHTSSRGSLADLSALLWR